MATKFSQFTPIDSPLLTDEVVGFRGGSNTRTTLQVIRDFFANFFLSSSATDGYIPKTTSTKELVNSGIFDDEGTILIGSSANPGYPADYDLQVGTETGTKGILIRAGDVGKLSFDKGANGDGLGRVWYNFEDDAFEFYTSPNGFASRLNLRLNSSGVLEYINAPKSAAGLPVNSIWSDLGTLKLTVTGDDNLLGLVTPEQFRSDVIITDLQCLQAAIDSGKAVLIDKEYAINGTAILPSEATVFGYGYASRLTTNVDAPILSIAGLNCTVSKLCLIGNSTGTSQSGVGIANNASIEYDGNKILDLFGISLGGALYVNDSVNHEKHAGNIIHGCSAISCGIGYYNKVGGEYDTYTNCNANLCGTGVRNNAGNVSFAGCNFSSNNTGVYIENSGSPNHGHSVMTGCKINHCQDYNILVDNVSLGYHFIGCAMHAGGTGLHGNILIRNSNGVSIKDCTLSVEVVDFDNSVRTMVQNNDFGSTPTFNNFVLGNVWFSGNTYKATRPTEDSIQEYTDNTTATAAGLKIGMEYRTVDALKTVH